MTTIYRIALYTSHGLPLEVSLSGTDAELHARELYFRLKADMSSGHLVSSDSISMKTDEVVVLDMFDKPYDAHLDSLEEDEEEDD
jgi:hypothetical protein